MAGASECDGMSQPRNLIAIKTFDEFSSGRLIVECDSWHEPGADIQSSVYQVRLLEGFNQVTKTQTRFNPIRFNPGSESSIVEASLSPFYSLKWQIYGAVLV